MPYERRWDLRQLDRKTILWRYMDFIAFLDMLVSKTLYLTRVDKLARLGDQFEGLFPDTVDLRGLFREEMTRRYNAEKARNGRRFYYANCWHANNSESDAMWKVYAKNDRGVAIRTTVERLKGSFDEAPEHIWIAQVRYENKWRGFLMKDPTLHACLTKRKPFVHEQEVRVIWFDKDAERNGRVGRDNARVQCNLNRLIETLYLAPTCSRWKPTVESVLRTYELDVRVVQSDLDRKRR
jgi:hypothetical protein